jgi:hypothetical protein
MKIWLVGVSDCESNSIVCACATKELAIKKMFEERDRLVAGWKESINQDASSKFTRNLYQPMVDALSGDDYEHWDNYPNDVPYISEMEVLDES